MALTLYAEYLIRGSLPFHRGSLSPCSGICPTIAASGDRVTRMTSASDTRWYQIVSARCTARPAGYWSMAPPSFRTFGLVRPHGVKHPRREGSLPSGPVARSAVTDRAYHTATSPVLFCNWSMRGELFSRFYVKLGRFRALLCQSTILRMAFSVLFHTNSTTKIG